MNPFLIAVLAILVIRVCRVQPGPIVNVSRFLSVGCCRLMVVCRSAFVGYGEAVGTISGFVPFSRQLDAKTEGRFISQFLWRQPRPSEMGAYGGPLHPAGRVGTTPQTVSKTARDLSSLSLFFNSSNFSAQLFVAVGSVFRSAKGAQVIAARKVTVHPKYLSSGGRNDIALVKLKNEAKTGKNGGTVFSSAEIDYCLSFSLKL